MPSSQDTEADELHLEVTAEGESVDDTQTTENGEGESDTVVNLETDDKKVEKLSPAEEQARKQVETWFEHVTSGAKKLEDAPTWVQKKLNARLEQSGPSTEEIVRKALAEQQEDAEFKALQAEIPSLTPAQAKELQDRYKSLRPAGKVVALKTSLEAMGLNSKLKEAEQRGIAKGKMSLPRSGQPSVRKSEEMIDGVPMSTITNNKSWNQLMKNRQE